MICFGEAVDLPLRPCGGSRTTPPQPAHDGRSRGAASPVLDHVRRPAGPGLARGRTPAPGGWMGAARHPDPDRRVVARPRQPRRRHRPRCADTATPTARDRRAPASERGARRAGDVQHREPVGSRHQRHAAPGPAQRAARPRGPDRRRDVLQGLRSPPTRRIARTSGGFSSAGATVLEGEHSITVSHDGFSWTAVRDALEALPHERPGRHRTVPD